MRSQTKAEKDAEPAGGVQSLRRAMAILEIVAESPRGIGLTDISKKVKLHNSTTFHLAKTLVAIGLLRQEPISRHYRIGPRLFGIAAGALDELELLNVAEPILIELAQQSDTTSHIAVRAGDEVIIIGKYDSASTICIAERIGSARPAHATAIGKILLASLSVDELNNFFARTPLTSYTPATIVEERRLRQELDEVRQSGFALDNGEFNAEVRCVASSVCDFHGRVIAAVGISLPVWRVHLNRVGELGASVKRAASRVSGALGSTDDKPLPVLALSQRSYQPIDN